MIGKAPGAVVCAHCKQAVAQQDCALCNRTVCPACHGNWATCDVPHGVELRLGLGARLRSVDRNGRYGLVSGWRGELRFVDLHEARVLPSLPHLPKTRHVEAGVPGLPYPAVTADGDVLHWTDTYGIRRSSFLRNESTDIAGGSVGILDELVLDYREQYAVGSRFDERVSLIEVEGARVRQLEPLQRQVVQAVACDGADRLLCSASYGLVHIDRFAEYGAKLQCLATLSIRDSDIAWLGVASRRVAVVSTQGSRPTIRVFRLDGDLMPDPDPIYRYPPKRKTPYAFGFPPYGGRRTIAAAISPDGRYMATGVEGSHEIDVHDVETGKVQRLGGHTDFVNLIRFTAQTRHIVSADYDNRVLIRPLHEERFVTQTRKLRVRSP